MSVTGDFMPLDAEGAYETSVEYIEKSPEEKRGELLEKLLDSARSMQIETIYTDCALDNLPFFESFGFRRASVVFDADGEKRIRAARSFLLENDDLLTTDLPGEAVVFRTDFDFPEDVEIVSADVLTLGFFEAYLNGDKLGDALYAPAWTNYNAQDFSTLSYPINDTFCHRVYALRLDLTPFARPGKNAFALHVGDGWYGQWESGNEGIKPYGKKAVCWRVTAKKKNGKTVVFSSSDGGFFKPSFVTKTSMYFGETHDYRLNSEDFFTSPVDGAEYAPAVKTEKPYTLIERQTCPADGVLRRIENAKVMSVFGDRTIYDLGENVAGFAVLRFSEDASKNDRVFVRYAENLNDDGSFNFHSTGGTARLSVDEFRKGRGDPGLLYPRFLWHAGRYVEVTGLAELEYFAVAASDVPVTAWFESSDELLNRLFDAYIRTQTANIHCCVPSDCPHRERLGYTGDGQLAAAAVMTCCDAKEMYKKWLRDVADCQDIYGGHVQHTAPFYGGGGGPGGWGCAIVEVPYRYAKFYGGGDILREYYPHMLRYLDYMAAHCDDNIVMREEPQGWCLGDWCTPHNSKTGIPIPDPFVNTYFYIRSLRQTAEVAAKLGHDADARRLLETEKQVVAAFDGKFFDEATGSYCGGVCGADAFALDLGLGDDRTLDNLVKKYRELGTFDTGIFGTPLVVKTLFERGFPDDAYALLANRGEVSFKYLIECGATTLWEEWFNEHSSSHPMFGAVVEFLFSYILGIRQPEGECGFENIVIDPAEVRNLDFAEGSVNLGSKRVTVRVERGKVVSKSIDTL